MSAPTQWTETILRNQRSRADSPADTLAESILDRDDLRSDRGRLGYNHLLDVADVLLEAPEMQNARGSRVADSIAQLPPEQVEYFAPIPVPDWVDEAALERAGKVWDRYMVLTLGVLYARSLPACYLIYNGIPALYETGKLAYKKYIYQRIYETGLMLDAVMSPGGLNIMKDMSHTLDEHLAVALKKAHPETDFNWKGHKLLAEDGIHIDDAKVEAALKERRENAPRYLAGPGYIAAKKVRLLHASMRFMLQYPDKIKPLSDDDAPATMAEGLSQQDTAWDSDRYGAPINQEDLAYTLLTFGIDIPLGLKRWGVRLSQRDCEDFLHTWRLVGHVIGIEDSLLPKNWDEAVKIYEAISKDQAAASDTGQAMTETLMEFLKDYLPRAFGLRRSLPPLLIKDQLGDRAKGLLSKKSERAANGFIIKPVFWCAKLALKLYFLISGFFFFLIPPLRRSVVGLMEDVGRGLIASWRGAYSRRPFYIPDDATGWKCKHGVNPPFLRELQDWRESVFNTIAFGSLILGCTIITGAITTALWLFDKPSSAGWMWTTLGLGVVSVLLLNVRVESLLKRRPTEPSSPYVDAHS